MATKNHLSRIPVSLIRDLMKVIDARLEAGYECDDLEIALETLLDDAEDYLSQLEYDSHPDVDDEPDVDYEPGVEEQFRAAWIDRDMIEDLPAHLTDVLVGCQLGGMSPSGFQHPGDDVLVRLARELSGEPIK